MKSSTELLDIKGLSKALRVPVQTIYYWVSRGEVPAIKIGRHLRFDYSEVLDHFRQSSSRSHLDSSTRLRNRSLKTEAKKRSDSIN